MPCCAQAVRRSGAPCALRRGCAGGLLLPASRRVADSPWRSCLHRVRIVGAANARFVAIAAVAMRADAAWEGEFCFEGGVDVETVANGRVRSGFRRLEQAGEVADHQATSSTATNCSNSLETHSRSLTYRLPSNLSWRMLRFRAQVSRRGHHSFFWAVCARQRG